MDKYDKLKKIKNNDIGEFNLKDTKTIGKLVNINDDAYVFIFVLSKVIVKFNCKLYGITLSPNKNINKFKNKMLQLCTDQSIEIDKCYSDDEISNILDKNELLIRIICDNFDLSGKLLVKLFDINDNNLSYNQILINENLVNEKIEDKFINFN